MNELLAVVWIASGALHYDLFERLHDACEKRQAVHGKVYIAQASYERYRAEQKGGSWSIINLPVLMHLEPSY